MQSRFARLFTIAAVSIAVIWGIKYYLFDSSAVPENSDYTLNLDEIRALARNQPGALPLQLRGLLIGESSFPRSAAVAGDGLFSNRALVFTAYQAVYPDRTAIIDTAHDRAIHQANFGETGFTQDAYDRMQAAMKAAALIVITHEHMDHVGGIAQSPHLAEITPRTLLTRDQINGPTIGQSGFPEGALSRFRDFDYDRLYSPAPGMVLIKAPGHSTGSQMIYLTLANGEEFLFVGDIVWHMDAIRRLRGRPRFVSLAFLGEDRDQVAAQIRTLHDLGAIQADARNNRLHIIVAHDAEQWREYLDAGFVQKGFL
ncbi:MAG: MBL fold metallo-hydrolase [Leptospirales bacterium]|jgi:glyoxylase-like metal-dependent hydrolase (beta-lactamase superfamily II)